ncbi:MAG TPA: phosphoribosylamine--glycine ligase, partial [Candidatus Binatia bacterium]|nr:phosphoribosylamine--glycine ligase [Candidatus Binatia bacterium]
AFMKRHSIPTAEYETFSEIAAAHAYIDAKGAPIVIKADGLAAGKGVVVAMTLEEAHAAVDSMLADNKLGDAGARVVIEEFLAGEEASFIVMVDGKHVLALASSQDHKRLLDGDRGPNTGGMGAYSPAPLVGAELEARILAEIIEPVVRGLARQGIMYTGILYAGLMVKDGKAKVLEFNVRLGDPEAQVLLARLRSDLADVVERTCTGRLAGTKITWDPRAAACVVLAAEGYPGGVERGRPITGVEALRGWRDGVVFHAGTRRVDGRLVTDGGRVLGVTALGETIGDAVETAYGAVDKIGWPGMHYRRDIGHRALAKKEAHVGT